MGQVFGFLPLAGKSESSGFLAAACLSPGCSVYLGCEPGDRSSLSICFNLYVSVSSKWIIINTQRSREEGGTDIIQTPV